MSKSKALVHKKIREQLIFLDGKMALDKIDRNVSAGRSCGCTGLLTTPAASRGTQHDDVLWESGLCRERME